MPPKANGKDKKKQEEPLEVKLQEEVKLLERARNDMQVEESFVHDKYKQIKAENERLQAEINKYRSRLGNATEDYADILEHRQEQIKAEEVKLRSMQAQVEKLDSELKQATEEVKNLKESNAAQAAKLEDASALLQDKENLEDAVRKQHDLIEKQSEELKYLRNKLEEQDKELNTARGQLEELTLKSSATTELKILFEEPWILQTSHARLRGDVPLDREAGSLCVLAGGKLLVIYGGMSRISNQTQDGLGREVAVLNVETMQWERPSTARTPMTSHSHTGTVVGRTKILVFGGVKGELAASDISILNTDNMKWLVPQVKGLEKPPPRHGHATCAVREKVFVFGGMSMEGALLNDLWVYDQDSLTWTNVTICGGHPPSPRRGATLSVTEDGRRLYMFGGNDGSRPLNDVYFMEIERLTWGYLPVHVGSQPEPREDAQSTIIAKYLIISGGCTQGGTRRLGDVQVLDLYSPRWECLDDGSYTVTMPWLKQRAAYSCFCGNKLYTLKPSMHEKLWELQVTEFALPEDIERLRNSKKRDLGVSEKLQLLDDAICGVSSIELQWRPPTKNTDRIERYKLMIATSTGVVKDVYQGKEQRFKITGLKPNTEYILCVKAIYDDGSFLWSESKPYMTKL
uniref:Fibronectin type-III domain-containing protein n=2 Tax=Dunaliella tertiolecta TaxID=3047 RepID=A0A7S3QQQ5_DUNTE